MRSRVAPVLAASLALLVAVACAAAPTPAAPSADPTLAPTERPSPTPVPGTPEPVATPFPSANAGDVDSGWPELTIEFLGDDIVEATLVDPFAKAWRLVIAGVAERSGERLELVVETGDVSPVITARELRDGQVIDTLDLSGMWDGTAASGGCHRTLPVCFGSDGFELPEAGDGTLAIRIALPDPRTPLTITGGTAGWPDEPFVLGPWTDTEAFPWGEPG